MAVKTADPSADASSPGDVSRTGLAAGIVQAARPRQWLKNVLVLAAPAAAGSLTRPAVLGDVALAFACFSLVASGTYLLNDARDAAADRLHPDKRRRPVASGIVPAPVASRVGMGLLAIGIALAVLTGHRPLAGVLVVYVAVQVGYSFGLKRIPVAELVLVASGFVLRALGGGAATRVPVSAWFLVVVSFAALLVVAGKRHAERLTLADEAPEHRRVLAAYTPRFLIGAMAVAAGVTVLAYGSWAFVEVGGQPWLVASVLPLAAAIARYGVLAVRGHGGAPEHLLLGDAALIVLGALWSACVAMGIYLNP